jgi:hypothetical protein
MPSYLTKDEIRQWRSSLEKITLEEFAARLGKCVEESKPTNDLVDIVMSKGTTTSSSSNNISDNFSAIAERAFKREQQISHTPFSINKKDLQNATEMHSRENLNDNSIKGMIEKSITKYSDNNGKRVETVLDEVEKLSSKSEMNIVLKKSLTDREQLVFEYFLNNVGKTVYAKDLAELLELPRDYVYKYIKNLRAKIEGDKLKNAPSGGFILSE